MIKMASGNLETKRNSLTELSGACSASVGSSNFASRRSSAAPDVHDAPEDVRNVRSGSKARNGSRKLTSQEEHLTRESNSRARPRKAHEPTPFLGIDLSTKHKNETGKLQNYMEGNPEEQIEEWMVPDDVMINLGGSRFTQNSENDGKSRVLSSQHQNRMPSRLSQFSTATSEWNSLVPKRHKKMNNNLAGDLQDCIVNTHVKMPFKHALQPVPNKKKRKPRPVSPSAELKEQTMMATVSVAKNLARQRPAEDDKKLGKLQKGRLKPLNPVKVQGPTISNCKGIVAEKRTNFGPPNRTLERRRQILVDHLQTKDFLYERPLTAESLHQTSEASDLSRNRIQEVEALEAGSEFEDNEQDEDKLIMNEDYLASGYTFVTDALDEAGELDEDALDEVLASSFQATNQNGRVTSEYKRPGTVQDPVPKAVRFADDHDENSDNGSRRTRSAHPRLSDYQKSRNGSATENGGSRIRVSSANGDSDRHSVTNGQLAIRIPSVEPEGFDNANNNNCLDTLRMSYNTILFTLEDSGLDKQRTGGVFRPRNKLGCWEDPQKPDNNKEALSVIVKADSTNDLQLLLKNQVKTQKPIALINQPRKDRPQSARNAGRAVFDLTKVHRQTRPLSAHARSAIHSHERDLDLSIRPDLSRSFSGNDLEKLPKDKAIGQWLNKTKDQRPMSGISLANTPSEASTSELQSDVEFKVHGHQMSQIVKAAICTQCHKPSNKIVIHTEDDEVILCDVCDRNNRAKINRIKKLAGQKNEPISDDEDLEADEMVTDNVEELENQLLELEARKRDLKRSLHNESPKKTSNSNKMIPRENGKTRKSKVNAPTSVGSNSPGANVTVNQKSVLKQKSSYDGSDTKDETDIFCRMDQLEATLAAIQQEIQVQMETVKTEEESAITTCEESEEKARYEQTENVEGKFPMESMQASELQSQSVSPDSDESRHDETLHVEENETPAESDSILNTDPGNKCVQGEISPFITGEIDNASACIVKVHHYKVHESNANTDENGNISTFEMQMIREHVDIGDITQNGISHNDDWNDGQLEVVATTKPVIQPGSSNTEEVTASCPPLCFKINAKPPEGHLYYFAYGTDMNINRFSTYINRTPAQRLWGLLFGFKLKFNKKGADTEAGGFPNIQYDTGSSVEGCLYLITPDDLLLLDKCVGYPEHFERVMLPIWMLNCSDADDHGVAQYCVPALVYVAQDEWLSKDEEMENSYAVDQCLKGGDLLSGSYRDFLSDMKHQNKDL